jgi:hypothetical protein
MHQCRMPGPLFSTTRGRVVPDWRSQRPCTMS